MSSRIRRQIYELTLSDLNAHAIWEFALDEENVKGQDEATVRPIDHPVPVSEGDTRIVRANFILADGTRLRGYLYAQPSGDTRIGGVQPAIVTAKGQVHFWHGTIEPTRDEMSIALVRLGRSVRQTFPLTFESEDGAISGGLNGFMYLNRDRLTEESTV